MERYKAKCCVMECMYKKEEILVGDKLNKEIFKESFKMSAMPILTYEWKEIIKHAVDSCVSLCEKSLRTYQILFALLHF